MWTTRCTRTHLFATFGTELVKIGREWLAFEKMVPKHPFFRLQTLPGLNPNPRYFIRSYVKMLRVMWEFTH